MDSSALLLRGGMASTISCKAYGVDRHTTSSTTVPRAESLCYTAVGLTIAELGTLHPLKHPEIQLAVPRDPI